MEIVHLPLGRLSEGVERNAVRRGLLRPVTRPALTLVNRTESPFGFCAACAAPIEFGTVWRGEQAFCSVECSLGGGRPA